MKAFNLPPEYVLYDLSYANILLYSAVLPSYDTGREKSKDSDTIRADDPENKEQVRKILFEQ
jgi:hypothetical protein